jgi:hexosaminidase
MIDVARNFRGPREMRRILDLMAFCKLNVLHWHLTDDEGWRLAIRGIPELVSVGARRGWPVAGMLPPSFASGPLAGSAPGSGYYSREEFIDLLRYARVRHIRVIPEIECPGHARSAIEAMDARYKALCRTGSAEAADYLLRDTLDHSVYESAQGWRDNVVCPALPSVYRFMDKVITDIAAMYQSAQAPLTTIHFGGDEVPSGAWEGSPECRKLAATADSVALREFCWKFFYSSLDSMLRRRGLSLSGWEEAASAGNDLNVYVWDNMIGGGNEDLPYRLANAGHSVVLACVSNNYYDLAYERAYEEPGYHWAGFLDMEKPFSFIPFDYYRNSVEDWQGLPVAPGYFNGKERLSVDGRRNILGVEGLLWGENLVSDQRAEYMLLPKLLGTAERAWAPDPGWGTGSANASYDSAWNIFLNTCGKRLLPRLSRLDGGYAYRIPPPGVVCRDGRIWANCLLPGFTIRYTTNGSEPTAKSPRYTAPLIYKSGTRVRVFDGAGRGGRSITVNNEHI